MAIVMAIAMADMRLVPWWRYFRHSVMESAGEAEG